MCSLQPSLDLLWQKMLQHELDPATKGDDFILESRMFAKEVKVFLYQVEFSRK